MSDDLCRSTLLEVDSFSLFAGTREKLDRCNQMIGKAPSQRFQM